MCQGSYNGCICHSAGQAQHRSSTGTALMLSASLAWLLTRGLLMHWSTAHCSNAGRAADVPPSAALHAMHMLLNQAVP